MRTKTHTLNIEPQSTDKREEKINMISGVDEWIKKLKAWTTIEMGLRFRLMLSDSFFIVFSSFSPISAMSDENCANFSL